MSKQPKRTTWGGRAAHSFHEADEPAHVALAADALLEGWTCDRVIAALVARVQRDERYLAYRKASGRHTSYDAQVQADMRATALAALWLGDGRIPDK